MKLKKLITLSLIFTTLSCTLGEKNNSDSSTNETKQIPKIEFELVNTFPHDSTHFTEGLEYHNDVLFESTGSPEELPNTSSKVGIINLNSGKMSKKVELDKTKYFGEGITILNGKLYQVTYRTKIGFVYDIKTFKQLRSFTFANTEGWGLTNDGTNIIMSDGTYNLTYFNPETLEVVKTLSVKENSYGKEDLNELEYIDGFIYVNIWKTDQIAKIDPSTGNIVGYIDCSSLKKDAITKNPSALETNGIAYNPNSKTFLITGKMWSNFYQIKLK